MALLVGPHMNPTLDRDPLPEDEEDEDVLPEPTDFGRLGRPCCDACDSSQGRNLLSAEREEKKKQISSVINKKLFYSLIASKIVESE